MRTMETIAYKSIDGIQSGMDWERATKKIGDQSLTVAIRRDSFLLQLYVIRRAKVTKCHNVLNLFSTIGCVCVSVSKIINHSYYEEYPISSAVRCSFPALVKPWNDDNLLFFSRSLTHSLILFLSRRNCSFVLADFADVNICWNIRISIFSQFIQKPLKHLFLVIFSSICTFKQLFCVSHEMENEWASVKMLRRNVI